MIIQYWWLLPLWLAAILIAIFIARRFSKKAKPDLHIAHSARLKRLPSYKKVFGRYKLLLVTAIIATLVSLIVAAVISARPASDVVQAPQNRNRDILLCLDVSGSMAPLNASVFDTFGKLVKEFDGERIGLTVFNSVAVTIFPLTDDYELISDQLAIGKRGFEAYAAARANGESILTLNDEDYEAWETIIDGSATNYAAGASLIGDGLTGCADRLGKNETKRSQSIILATDNQLFGDPIVSLDQAATLMKNRGIRLYALDPASDGTVLQATAEKVSKELKAAALSTGGAYYKLSDSSATSEVVNEVNKQEATYFAGKANVVTTDIPAGFLIALLATFSVVILVAWRLSL